MSTPQSTPVRHVKLGIATAKSLPLTNEYKRLLSDQHHRLTLKHQQDLDLLDDIRGYVKARLSIEKDYTNALQKLAKHHSSHINKKFALLSQLDSSNQANEQHKQLTSRLNLDHSQVGAGASSSNSNSQQSGGVYEGGAKSDESKPPSLYKVWHEHISRLQATSKNRSDQFEQLIMIVDKLKDIRQHKASIGKKCLETHLKRIQEDLLVSLVEVERAKKLYYEDESQARKARENEERIKKKRTGLLTKFTDLQAKKEKSSAQREATDIQSTQARNDYIMALAAANAHLNYYYHRDLNDFIQLIDDGVLDHCKIFMATLSECDINSLKETLQQAQYWSRLINQTGSSQTNYIFLNCEQSKCLRTEQELAFEACNNDPIQRISLEHNADYALQHEIDKWFTWFKKECRNLSQLMHQLDACQHAFAEGKRSIEVNGQTVEDLEPKIIELKQQIRKCEAAKLKAQARLKVIKEGGMQIEEWSDVELEIRADMARAQEELERAQRLKEMKQAKSLEDSSLMQEQAGGQLEHESSTALQEGGHFGARQHGAVQLQISRNSDDEEDDDDDTQPPGDSSTHNLASVSRSTSNLLQKQQNAVSGYSALTDPSLVWQDDYSSAWGAGAAPQPASIVMSSSFNEPSSIKSPISPRPPAGPFEVAAPDSSQPLDSQEKQQQQQQQQQQQIPNANMSIQSSSPLSAIMNGGQHLSQSPYQVGIMSEAYKSDYECDYTRTGHQASMRSAASSAEPTMLQSRQSAGAQEQQIVDEAAECGQQDVGRLLNQRVVALYAFEKNNDDDLAFNEDDVLVVTETNPEDTNWIRARLEATGEQGYIPSSYVRLLEGETAPLGRMESAPDGGEPSEAWQAFEQPQSGAEESQRLELALEEEPAAYCRAVYDYEPEADTFEEDGLPHLALTQGELMRVIDQGADDGWWLVEKAEDGRRGHVPSMLVEELEPDEEAGDGSRADEEEEEEEFDEGEVSERELDGDEDAPVGPAPDFEPPVLTSGPSEELQSTVSVEQQEEGERQEPAMSEGTANIASLIPTSFIIIEPTPEVESRRFDESFAAGVQDTPNAQETTSASGPEGEQDGVRQVVSTGEQPSSQVSYSVVKEDFVLERPARKPNQCASGSMEEAAGGQQHEATIEEEEQAEELEASSADGWPMPPAVVIDSVEAIPRSPDLSFDQADDRADEQEASSSAAAGEAIEGGQQAGEAAAELARRPIKHTGNVDVSPILRHHAEEFCKQLIEEAILLAPGSRIGPSTSSASVAEDQHQQGRDQMSANTNEVRAFEDEAEEDEEAEEEDTRRDYSLDDSA